MAPVNTTAKELKEPTRASSRLLGCDDGLISLAPPAPKKRKKKGEAHPPSDDNATQIAPQPPNPEGRREPNPTQALLEGEDTPLDSLPAKKKRKSSKPKDKGKSKSAEEENTAAAVPLSTVLPSQDASEAGSTTQKKKESTRKRKASEVARNAAAQEKTAEEKKAAKEKRKRDKAKAIPISETPEETQAFLAAARGLSQPTGAGHQSPQDSATSAPAPPTRPLRNEQREEVLQRLRSNLAASIAETPNVPAGSASASPLSTCSTPVVPLSTASSTLPSRAHTPAFSVISARDDSPGPFQDLEDDVPFDEGGVEQEELLDALKGLPKHLAPVVELPEPLSGPSHPPQRTVPLGELDMTGLSARQRKSLKASRKLKVHDLVESDRLVVSAALDRAKAILITHNPYPARPVASMIAAQANVWACRKFKTNLTMEVDGEYEDLILQRFGTLRSGMHAHALKEVPIRFSLKSTAGDDQEAMTKNMETVEMWLLDLNFTCPDAENLGDFYENPLFYDLIKLTYFPNAKASGPSHPDLWSSAITVPCLAHAATVVEKVLLDYGATGTHKKSDFKAETYGLKWMSHVITLKEMYLACPDRLDKHCQMLASRLMSPFAVQKAANKVIGPRIPISRISALYGKGKVSSTGEHSPGAATPTSVTPRRNRKASGPSTLRQATPGTFSSPQDSSTLSPLSAIVDTATSSTSTSALQSPITLSEPNLATRRYATNTGDIIMRESGDGMRHSNPNGMDSPTGVRSDSQVVTNNTGGSGRTDHNSSSGESSSGSGSEESSTSESGSSSDGDGTHGAGPAIRALLNARSKAAAGEVEESEEESDEEEG